MIMMKKKYIEKEFFSGNLDKNINKKK